MANRTVELKIPCETGYEKVAMRMASDLAEKMGFSQERAQDLEIAVAEACINAMEHGNQFDVSTKIYVTMTIHEDRLAIDVVDEGRSGRPSTQVEAPDMQAQIDGLIPPGGMGLFVIKSLVDEAEFVEPDLGTGNQFRMVIHLQQPGQPGA
ncbi:MAG: ATP-binding protein [Chloroflexota bacterium]|nr:ATP-binding protein [Chloroflexota bacterium]